MLLKRYVSTNNHIFATWKSLKDFSLRIVSLTATTCICWIAEFYVSKFLKLESINVFFLKIKVIYTKCDSKFVEKIFIIK